MPKVSDEYRLARREEIIDVALRCFVRTGFTRTSVADLVAESGLSAGAIYGNFPGGKDEIFVAAATRILQTRRIELDERRREDGILSPGATMATLISGIRGEKFSAILPQLWGEAAVDPGIRELVRGVFVELRETIIGRLAEWAAEHPDRIGDDPRAWAERTAPVILSVAPGFILQQTLLDDFDVDGYLAALPEVLPH